jgi:O-glycosyl hydrolase
VAIALYAFAKNEVMPDFFVLAQNWPDPCWMQEKIDLERTA